VGLWYEDFRSTSDEEVMALLTRREDPGGEDRSDPGGQEEAAVIPIATGSSLSGELTLPPRPHGVVAFAHGSGSSRLSPRNLAVARALSEAGLATLLFDLLTPGEEVHRAKIFDIALLTERLLAASAWLTEHVQAAGQSLGYFGASTGAAAALSAAAELGGQVSAVVSRGGRPDLARNLETVSAPTLLIVGGADREVLELNRAAQRRLRCPSELVTVPGATHLFGEPGALEQVSRLAGDWFTRHLSAQSPPAAART
jgi:putative phosphoribosyl transferase